MSPPRMLFGKHRGTPLSDVPLDYLLWLRDRDLREPLRARVHLECARRLDGERPALPALAVPPDVRDAALRIVATGLRSEAKRAHPDVGGSNAEMSKLNRAAAALRQALGA